MRWDLLAIAAGVWIFFSVHFIFAGRVKQMIEAGFLDSGGSGEGMLGVSKAICVLAMLNQVFFFAVFGFKISWLWAAVVVFGGYAASLVYMLLTRGPVFDGLLNPTHKLGWVAIPVLSIALWLVAF